MATLLIGTLATTGWGLAQSESAAGGSVELYGKVQGAGSPIAGSIVTLYATGEGEPVQIANAKSGEDGSFRLGVAAEAAKGGAGKVFYVVARGGSPKAVAGKGPDDSIALMDVLGLSLPKTITVNELTTVASAFTSARFINGESISGKPLGLKIAAGNMPNLVDPVSGAWGKVLVDPFNSNLTTTLANLDTLGSLISAFFTVANEDWRARFLKAATAPGGTAPKTTLEAMADIARRPWLETKTLYQLFDEAYPEAKEAGRRAAPFVRT